MPLDEGQGAFADRAKADHDHRAFDFVINGVLRHTCTFQKWDLIIFLREKMSKRK
jgi:hypothetical protein